MASTTPPPRPSLSGGHDTDLLQFRVDHTIQAKPGRIFDAYTKPDQTTKWWSHPGKRMRIDEMDVRPGGRWRFTHVHEDGEVVMHGEYREVKPVTRLSYTYNHGEGTDNEILAIVDIHPTDEGTRVTLANRFRSREQRDAMLSYGAEVGAQAALRALADLVEEA